MAKKDVDRHGPKTSVGSSGGRFHDARSDQSGEAYPAGVPAMESYNDARGQEPSTGPMPGNYVPNPNGSKNDMGVSGPGSWGPSSQQK